MASFCTRCGHRVGETMRFCTNCGARLAPAGGEDAPVTAAPQAEPGGPPAEPGGPPSYPPEPARPGRYQPESYPRTDAGPAGRPAVAAPPPPPQPAPPQRRGPPALTSGVPPVPAAVPHPSPSPPPAPGPPLPPVPLGGGVQPSEPEFYPDPYPEPPRRRRGVPGWLMIVAAVVAVLGGAGGWYAATHHTVRPAASTQPPASTKPSAGGGGSQAATSPSSGTSSAVPSTPTATAGSSAVALGPGVSGPAAGSVSAFLGRYFAAINSHDYPAYISLFAPGADPGETAQAFEAGYASSSDSSETLVALGSTPSGKTTASVTFNSHQSPASSATHTACTSWRVTLFLVSSGTSYLISHPPASYHASAQACS